MDAITIIKKLETYPTFTVDTIANILNKNPPYAKLYLNRLKQRCLVHQLQRNIYTVHSDPLIVASHIIWPSYISLWTAFRYHNMTEQLPTSISIITTRQKRRSAITFANTTITFHHMPTTWFFGYEKLTINSFEVFMAEPEKALIDALLLKAISATEIYDIFQEQLKMLSTDKLVIYTLRTKNKALMKRIGWMLSSHSISSAKRLLKHSYRTTIPFDYARPANGPKDTTWGLILNSGTK
jgi:predicted transcriptional regulator of viral defense system